MSSGRPSMAECCQFCGRGREVESVCGELHVAEVPEGEQGSKKRIAHHKCLQYSANLVQYGFANFGGFKINKVIKEIKRGRYLKCDICKKKKNSADIRGATGGCAIMKCGKSYHFYCAKTNKNVLTRRMVKQIKDGKTQFLYRVFCNKDHLEMYLKQEENIGIICQSLTESESDAGSDTDEDGSVPATGGTSSSSSGQDQAMSPASDTSSLSDHNSSQTEEYNQADAHLYPQVTVIGTVTSVPQGQALVNSGIKDEEVFCDKSLQSFDTSDLSEGNEYTEGGKRPRQSSTPSSSDDEQESPGYDGGGQKGTAEGRGHQRRAKSEGQARRRSIKGKDPNKEDKSKSHQRPGTDKPGKVSEGPFPVCKKPKKNSHGAKKSPGPSGCTSRKEGVGKGDGVGEGSLLPGTSVTGSDKPSKALAPRTPNSLRLNGEDTDSSLNSLNHNKHRASYVLCIGDGGLDRDNMAALHQTAKEKFDVVSEAVFLWPIKGPSLTTMQTLFFMLDVANAVKDSINRKGSQLDKMVFQSNEKLVSDYESKFHSMEDLGLSETVYQEIQYQELNSMFATLEAECECPVGCLVQEKTLSTRVLYLLLSDITDPSCQIRSRLISGLVHQWPADVTLRTSSPLRTPHQGRSF